jgi:hypothetical protein
LSPGNEGFDFLGAYAATNKAVSKRSLRRSNGPAILCDMVGGKNKKWDANMNADKKLVLDHLIAKGFVEPMDQHSPTKYQPTGKTEMLFAQLCSGVSGGYA